MKKTVYNSEYLGFDLTNADKEYIKRIKRLRSTISNKFPIGTFRIAVTKRAFDEFYSSPLLCVVSDQMLIDRMQKLKNNYSKMQDLLFTVSTSLLLNGFNKSYDEISVYLNSNLIQQAALFILQIPFILLLFLFHKKTMPDKSDHMLSITNMYEIDLIDKELKRREKYFDEKLQARHFN